MQDLYNISSKPLHKKLLKNECSILEQYLAFKENLKTIHEGESFTKSEKYLYPSSHPEVAHELGQGNVKDFKYCCTKTHTDFRSKDDTTVLKSDLKRSLDVVDETFQNIKQDIQNQPSVCSSESFGKKKDNVVAVCKNEFNECKDTSQKNLFSKPDIKSKEDFFEYDHVDRILKMVEVDYHLGAPKVESKIVARVTAQPDVNSIKINTWSEQLEWNYYSFIFLTLTLLMLSVLQAIYYTFQTIKVYFDKVLIRCWKWTRGMLLVSQSGGEQNMILFIILTPLIILLLITYSGFLILYFLTKILLSKVPPVITTYFNFARIEPNETYSRTI